MGATRWPDLGPGVGACPNVTTGGGPASVRPPLVRLSVVGSHCMLSRRLSAALRDLESAILLRTGSADQEPGSGARRRAAPRPRPDVLAELLAGAERGGRLTREPRGSLGVDENGRPNLLTAAFLIGASTLALEVAAARAVALNAGVSLYGWASVIGAVLAGLAAGNAIAATRADQASDMGQDPPNRRRVLVLAVVTAAWVVPAFVVATGAATVALLQPLPLGARLALLAIALAFLPSLLLGATAPPLARLSVRTEDHVGATLGRLAAATTLGSLVGVVGAGGVLMPLAGVRGTAGSAATALLLAAALMAGRRRATAIAVSLAALGALVPLAAPALVAVAVPHACDRESAYQCIRVVDDETLDGRPFRRLYLDSLPHAEVSVDEPRFLVAEYLGPAVEVAAYLRPVGGPPPTVLLIGGGGYSLARYLAAVYPGATIDVLELDAEVTAIARERLGLAADAPLGIRHGDARQTIETLPPQRRYHLVVLDAFSDVVVPFHLTTREFDQRIKARLAPDGVYLALVHDRVDEGRLLPAFLRTVGATFGAVTVLGPGPGVQWYQPRPRTWSVVASATPLEWRRFRAVRRWTPQGPFPPISESMSSEILAELLARTGPPHLTDDHAPVEILAAPLVE
jgi:hypothetical protein